MDEQNEQVEVKAESYRRYLRDAGGVWVLIVINLAIFCFIACSITMSYLTQKWAYSTPEVQ